MTHYDEGTIHAWLDGALNDDETAEIERHVATCGECAARVTEARGLLAGASRILLALDDVPGGVVPVGTAGTAQKQRGRRWVGPAAWAIAATLVVAVGIKTVGRFEGTTVGQSDSRTVGQQTTAATAAGAQPTMEAAKKVKDVAKATGGVSAQANSVKAVQAPAVTARTDAPPPPQALARKDAPVLKGAVAGGMAAVDSPAARRTDAMRGQAMALNNVVVTGVAEAARPAAAPSLGSTPVCYADGRNTFVFDSTRSEPAAPVIAADAAVAASVRRVLRDTSGAVGTWERVGADSVALFVGGREWRGAVAPAGAVVVVEGKVWTRTACRRVGG